MKKEFAKYCKLIVNNPKFIDSSFDHEFGTQKEVEFEYDSAYLEYKTEDYMVYKLDEYEQVLLGSRLNRLFEVIEDMIGTSIEEYTDGSYYYMRGFK